MGLPLFVAKVESDIPHKCPRKSRIPSASPPRSNIRRPARIGGPRTTRDSRDRIGRLRRLIALEASDRSISGVADDTPRPFRDSEPTVSRLSVAAHMSQRFASVDIEADTGSRRCIRRLDHVFGPNWHERDWQRPQQDTHGDHWNIERPTRTSLARAVRVTAQPSSTGHFTSIDIPHDPSWPPVNGYPYTTSSSNRYAVSGPPQRLQAQLDRRQAQRTLHPTASNGLGDRVQSPSPEAWDTLLSTMTPDPQPPSANSSFVSTTASQTAGVSTNTSLSERLPTPGPVYVPDDLCDSADEDSEEEELSRLRLRRTPHEAFETFGRIPGMPMLPGEPPHIELEREAMDAVADYVRRNAHRPAENITVMVGGPQGEISDPRSEDEEWRPRPFPGGVLPGYSAVVHATRADAPEADRTEAGRNVSSRSALDRLLEASRPDYRTILDRLQNNEDVPDELWAAAGSRGSWARDGRD